MTSLRSQTLSRDCWLTSKRPRPSEADNLAIPVNVGITAETVRQELVVLAIALNAGVPQGSDHYLVNANGTVTVDYIQTNNIALPVVNVREIHSIDVATCKIEKIVGYVHGPLTAVTAGLDLGAVAAELAGGETVGQVLAGLGV